MYIEISIESAGVVIMDEHKIIIITLVTQIKPEHFLDPSQPQAHRFSVLFDHKTYVNVTS